jgi:hypothetical protein
MKRLSEHFAGPWISGKLLLREMEDFWRVALDVTAGGA